MPEQETLMELFAREYRPNEFFKNVAIAEIKVAYRVMEYLCPDSMEKPEIKPQTLKLMLEGMYDQERLVKASQYIIDECDSYFGSDHAQEGLEKDCQNLIKKLLPAYIQNKATEKEKKRLELLKQIEELDKT